MASVKHNDDLVPQAKVARVLGITPQRVSQLAKEGVFPCLGRAKYPLAACVQAYLEKLEAHAAKVDGDPDYRKEQARLTKAKADRAELDLQAARREMIPLPEAMHVVRSLAMRFRSSVLSFPSKAAAQVHGKATIGETREALKARLRLMLSELSEERIEEVADELAA